MSVSEFGDTYQSLMRIRARDKMEQLALIQNAFHGNSESLKIYQDQVKEWLPQRERDAGKGSAEDLAKAMKRGK